MSEKFDFNFKVKIIRTDLTGGDYSYGYNYGGSPNSIMYENSSYISKLFFINNVSGGIMSKEKIEDMPERYKRFISPDIPGDAEMLRNIKKELDILANREEIGQNVFYSSLASNIKNENENKRENKSEKDFDVLLNRLEDFLDSGEFGDFDEFDEYDEDDEDYGAYENEDEVRDILHLNHYYNSEAYKMSKVKYDFSSFGHISLVKNGMTDIIDIIYDESEMTGFKDSYARFMFNKTEKNIVTMCRRSFFETWLTFEKGKRISVEHTDKYTGAVAFFTAETKELVNNMTIRGGDMRLVYVTETNGVPCEMITHTIEAEPAGE